MPQVTERVLFSGHVQGVGFRWTTERIARGLPVTGYVRNLMSGQVELVVRGDPGDIETLLQRISDHFGGGIRDCHREVVPGHDEFSDFQIRR